MQAAAEAEAEDGVTQFEMDVPLGDFDEESEDAQDADDIDVKDAATHRTKRQFSFNSTLRISSCSDKGLSYVCETKYLH